MKRNKGYFGPSVSNDKEEMWLYVSVLGNVTGSKSL